MALSYLVIIIAQFLISVAPHVIRDRRGLEYATPETQRENLPLLKLPYGTWQATKYDSISDVRIA
jgi:hypothetical protein